MVTSLLVDKLPQTKKKIEEVLYVEGPVVGREAFIDPAGPAGNYLVYLSPRYLDYSSPGYILSTHERPSDVHWCGSHPDFLQWNPCARRRLFWCGSILELSLHAVSINGPVPSELGSLATLQRLTLFPDLGRTMGGICSFCTDPEPDPEYRNAASIKGNVLNVTGPLPHHIGNLTNLEYMRIVGTRLDGRVPTQIGQLQNLVAMEFENNGMIDGVIPTEIGRMTNLFRITISGHPFLSGKLPSQLGNMDGLYTADFSNNLLTGEVPKELLQLASTYEEFVILKLYGNNFTGGFERVFCSTPLFSEKNNSTGVVLVSADCGDSPDEDSFGAVTCTCCKECHSKTTGTFVQQCLPGERRCVQCGYDRTARACFNCEHIDTSGIPSFETVTERGICGNGACRYAGGGTCQDNPDYNP